MPRSHEAYGRSRARRTWGGVRAFILRKSIRNHSPALCMFTHIHMGVIRVLWVLLDTGSQEHVCAWYGSVKCTYRQRTALGIPYRLFFILTVPRRYFCCGSLLFLLSVFILWFIYDVSDIFCKFCTKTGCWNSQHCSVFSSGFRWKVIIGSLMGLFSRKFEVWPIYFLTNVITAIKGPYFCIFVCLHWSWCCAVWRP